MFVWYTPIALLVALLSRWLAGLGNRLATAVDAVIVGLFGVFTAVATSLFLVWDWELFCNDLDHSGFLTGGDCSSNWSERLVALGVVMVLWILTLQVGWGREDRPTVEGEATGRRGMNLLMGGGTAASVSLVVAGLMTTIGDDSLVREGDGCAQSELRVMRNAMVGDLDAVVDEIDSGTDPNTTDAAGNSALACAGPKGHVEVVVALLSLGANPDTVARDGDVVTADAVLHCQDEVLASLLESGAQLTGRSRSGDGLVRIAVDLGSHSALEILISNGSNPNSWEETSNSLFGDPESTSPCPDATPDRVDTALMMLLDAGASPDPILREAVRRELHGSAEEALRVGADPNIEVHLEDSSLDSFSGLGIAACAHGAVEVEDLFDMCDAVGGLDRIAADGEPISNGEFEPDKERVSFVLLEAAWVGDQQLVELLVEYGADPNQATETGWTALHAAAAGGDVPLMDLLLAAGSATSAGPAPLTPQEVAMSQDHAAAAERLGSTAER